MELPRWVFHAGWSAGAGREGVRMRLDDFAGSGVDDVLMVLAPSAVNGW
nr:hypothetical protein [Saccharomonospora azurea]